MCDRSDRNATLLPRYDACAEDVHYGTSTSRRSLLKASAALLSAGSVALLSETALGQSATGNDPALAEIQARPRTLIKGGTVLTLDPQVGDFAQADILIEDGKIRAVRPDIAADGAAVIDATNRIVIPGFVDTHSHSYQGLLRNILTNGLLNPDYNRDVQTILTPAYTAADAYAGTLITALGMIDTGTTTMVDISQVSHTPEHSDACIQALQESGIRAVYAYHRGSGPNAQYPQDIKRLQRTYFSSKEQLLTLALTANLNSNVFALAREIGVPVVQHIVGKDLSDAVLELGRAGLLRPGDEYIHCIGINDAAWRLLKETGANVSICAPIDMAMGHGMPTIQEALDYGFRPSLSSDHGVTIAQDFFTVMRTTFMLQRLLILQRARNGEQNLPALLTCRDMLEFATMAGARCANLDNKIGTLTPGKDADVVLLACDRLDVWPLNNAPGVVVNLMNPGHVDTVLIAGKVKKWRGHLVGIDPVHVRHLVAKAREAVFRRAGFSPNLLG
jgi:5-methylthioadenosine/S-adenosylhomocysteine deaminase